MDTWRKSLNGKGENDKGKRLAYDSLVWDNSFFGEVTEDMIENSLGRISTQNPTHAFHPEIFSVLRQIGGFSQKDQRVVQKSLASKAAHPRALFTLTTYLWHPLWMELTEAQYALLASCLPRQRSTGRLSNLHVLKAILSVAEHGCTGRG